MFSKFFIDRPIFSTVISIVIVIAGLLALKQLPVSQYPDITPPTVQVQTFYPGANAQTISESVAQVIEEQVNGVDNMIYFNSTCANDGSYSLTITFEIGTDIDMATVLVQNHVSQALASLPQEVQRAGVITKKNSTNIVMLLAITSTLKDTSDVYLSNFVSLQMKDELARVYGVGDVFSFGAGDYSMRVWLDEEKMSIFKLNASDINNAINEQNIQVAAGKIGAPPAPTGQNFEYVLNAEGRLKTTEQFENIIIKTDANGGLVRLKDVAKVELGAKTYGTLGRFNGNPTALVAIFQRPGANALKIAESVQNKITELKKSFPSDIVIETPLDTTKFVTDSIEEVAITLVVAVLLVIFTIFFFLQDWRATIIPTITIPISLIGTFAVMFAIGFSINLLTLFGLILAIGIVVDDAIVVVEATAHHIQKNNLSPYDAAVRAMKEVSGAVIATTLVLLAVFVPSAMMGGIVGQMFRQFAITISVATVFSSINALTMTPALSAILLRPAGQKKKFFLFKGFEWIFEKSITTYQKIVRSMIRFTFIALIIFAAVVFANILIAKNLPTGFLPTEDFGYAMGIVQLPDAASFERSDKVAQEVYQKISKIEGIKSILAVPGYSLIDSAATTNCVTLWFVFDDLKERNLKGQTLEVLMQQINGALNTIREGVGFAFTPPAINGLGSVGGFEMKVEDRSNQGFTILSQVVDEIVEKANQQSIISGARSTFRATVPQFLIKLNRDRVKQYDVSISEVYNSIQTYLGGSYINDFSEFGRTYQVKVQANGSERANLSDIGKIQIRNQKDEMVSLSSLIDITDYFGPQIINRYNMYPSASITGNAAAGFSSGEALSLMEEIAEQVLPEGIGYDWTGMAREEKSASAGIGTVLILSILFGYLFLCAQYESWSLSLCVMLSVPMALLGTVLAVLLRQMDINVYTQIGVVLLIGLAAKTAILIVEFASDLHKTGKSIDESAEGAATLRYRAVLMTAISFVFGTYPLLIASGTGAASRQALGTAVFWGMISGTIFTVMLVPVFYKIIQSFSERISSKKKGEK